MQAKQLQRTIDFKLPTAILGASLASDGSSLVAGCMDGVYRVDLNARSFKQIGSHDSYVSSAAFLTKQGQLISAGYDGVLQWFNAQTNEVERKVKLHEFWSWDMAVSPDEKYVASVTGQYLADGYKYEPAPEREPSVKLLAADSGTVLHSLPHVPSVQAVAFSHDSRYVAAGNLMGEVRIWECASGKEAGRFTTSSFTSWGIIKSHCYLGGIFAMHFAPDDQSLIVCGMGDMKDPMAGNGRQLWQRWSWCEPENKKLAETHPGESGEGLMEAIAFHPNGEFFAMGGRLRGGEWNVGLFDLASGSRIGTIKSGYRVTQLAFTDDGNRLVLAGTQGQPDQLKDGKFPDFGRVEVYDVRNAEAKEPPADGG